jgi:hypothetical protein
MSHNVPEPRAAYWRRSVNRPVMCSTPVHHFFNIFEFQIFYIIMNYITKTDLFKLLIFSISIGNHTVENSYFIISSLKMGVSSFVFKFLNRKSPSVPNAF